MNIRLLLSAAACAALFTGNVYAADETDREEQVVGFGSGTGMGAGAGVGSASSVANISNSQNFGSGSGSQTFGGGFEVQQSNGYGPLSTDSSASTGTGPVINHSSGDSFRAQ